MCGKLQAAEVSARSLWAVRQTSSAQALRRCQTFRRGMRRQVVVKESPRQPRVSLRKTAASTVRTAPGEFRRRNRWTQLRGSSATASHPLENFLRLTGKSKHIATRRRPAQQHKSNGQCNNNRRLENLLRRPGESQSAPQPVGSQHSSNKSNPRHSPQQPPAGIFTPAARGNQNTSQPVDVPARSQTNQRCGQQVQTRTDWKNLLVRRGNHNTSHPRASRRKQQQPAVKICSSSSGERE